MKREVERGREGERGGEREGENERERTIKIKRIEEEDPCAFDQYF